MFTDQQIFEAAKYWGSFLPGASRLLKTNPIFKKDVIGDYQTDHTGLKAVINVAFDIKEKNEDKKCINLEQLYNFISVLSSKIKNNKLGHKFDKYCEYKEIRTDYDPPTIIRETLQEVELNNIPQVTTFPWKTSMFLLDNGQIWVNNKLIYWEDIHPLKIEQLVGEDYFAVNFKILSHINFKIEPNEEVYTYLRYKQHGILKQEFHKENTSDGGHLELHLHDKEKYKNQNKIKDILKFQKQDFIITEQKKNQILEGWDYKPLLENLYFHSREMVESDYYKSHYDRDSEDNSNNSGLFPSIIVYESHKKRKNLFYYSTIERILAYLIKEKCTVGSNYTSTIAKPGDILLINYPLLKEPTLKDFEKIFENNHVKVLKKKYFPECGIQMFIQGNKRISYKNLVNNLKENKGENKYEI